MSIRTLDADVLLNYQCLSDAGGNPLQCSCLENPRTAEPGGLPSMGSHRVGHG